MTEKASAHSWEETSHGELRAILPMANSPRVIPFDRQLFVAIAQIQPLQPEAAGQARKTKHEFCPPPFVAPATQLLSKR